ESAGARAVARRARQAASRENPWTEFLERACVRWARARYSPPPEKVLPGGCGTGRGPLRTVPGAEVGAVPGQYLGRKGRDRSCLGPAAAGGRGASARRLAHRA